MPYLFPENQNIWPSAFSWNLQSNIEGLNPIKVKLLSVKEPKTSQIPRINSYILYSQISEEVCIVDFLNS